MSITPNTAFINQFKQNLLGGGARANLYQVNGVFPAAAVAAARVVNPSNQIRFLCTAASLPAFNVQTIEQYFMGRPLKLAGDREFSPWSITILNDTNFALRNAFERWSDLINNIESNSGRQALSEYGFEWRVTQLDRQGRGVKTYKFVDCWPSAISGIDLNYNVQNEIETFTVTMQYQYYQSEGTSS